MITTDGIFERVVMPSGKIYYHHVANGKARVELIKACRRGEITPDEMRARAKRLPYSFTERQREKYLATLLAQPPRRDEREGEKGRRVG